MALLVGFGVMIGRLLEVTGGAQVLADTLINRFGEKRAPLALGVAALLFGFPIFFDAGLVVFLPIILTVARRFGGSLLLYALPAAGAFAAMHALVPPHPGPVAAAEALEADIGLTLLVGVPVAVVSWYVGVLPGVPGPRQPVSTSTSPDALFGEVNDGRDGRGERHRPARTATTRHPRRTRLRHRPRPAAAAAGADLLQHRARHAGHRRHDRGGRRPGPSRCMLLGDTTVALLITMLAAIVVLGRRDRSMADVSTILDKALGPICSIILITGAGGMFGGVLRAQRHRRGAQRPRCPTSACR